MSVKRRPHQMSREENMDSAAAMWGLVNSSSVTECELAIVLTTW